MDFADFLPYLVICTVALLVAALTLFSGFGLGTLLMPAFALFMPVEVAIAATGVVHLANNLFKLVLVGRDADRKIVLKFGIPAALAALVGALLLGYLAGLPPLFEYTLGTQTFTITPVSLAIALLMAAFALLELSPRAEKLTFPTRYIPLGGLLSGFFGGLSGHQGALRAAFLVRAGLTKEAFIGTASVCSVMVDVVRLVVYGFASTGERFALLERTNGIGIVVAGSLAAFVGSFIGTRLVKQVTMRRIQVLVGVMLLLLAVALGTGLLRS